MMNALGKISRHRQNGFSLIEALIAVVVLATGLLALTALQGAIVRNSADAKARSLMAAYAQSELERMRLSGVGALATNSKSSTSITDPSDPLLLAASAAGLGAVNQVATVTQFIHDSTAATADKFVENPAAPGDLAHFKRVGIQLSWIDATGGNRSLRMDTIVSPLALTASKVLVDREPPESAGLLPIVRRPSPVSEGMIPIALGDGQDTAATNPKPVLIGKKNDTLVADTRFEILTYNPGDNLGNAAFARFNKRIETAVVGCTCQNGTDGFSTTGPDSAVDGFLKSASFQPSYWDGEKYSEPKRVAGGVTTSPAEIGQSPLCDVCCRDHKDPVLTAVALYKPWPRIDETEHGHYRLDANGAFEAATAGEYMESCRVIRVNGVWRVTPDPRLDDLALVPTQLYSESSTSPLPPTDSSVATSPLLSDSGKTNYGTYLFGFLKRRYFDSSAKNTNFDDSTRHAMQDTAGINNPRYVPIKASNDKRWLHSRGVLVDHLVPVALTRLRKAIDDCPATSTTEQQKAQCVLPFLPFTTINVTELARWGAHLTSVTGITPSAEYGNTSINYGQARMRRHNSAVAMSPAISPDDDATRLFDEQLVALLNSVRSGVWLSVSDAAGVVFGNPAAPTRGAATVAGDLKFNVSWSGVTAATDNEKNNDPELFVVPDPGNPASEVDCKKATAKNTSNPYTCTTGSGSDVMLALASFNRKVQLSRSQNSNPCNSSNNAPKVPLQATCLAHSLTRVTIDGVDSAQALSSYTLVSGTAGKASEKRTLVLPSVRTTAPDSAVTLIFTSSSTNATAVCESTTFVEWSCN